MEISCWERAGVMSKSRCSAQCSKMFSNVVSFDQLVASFEASPILHPVAQTIKRAGEDEMLCFKSLPVCKMF